MSILTQLLLIAVVLATVYASFVHNREKYAEIIGILPDFRKLMKETKPSPFVKVVVFVPDSHAEAVRAAAGGAGGGAYGHYTFTSFSSQGTGRFIPGQGARPYVGEIGKLELIDEERIELLCSRENLKNVVTAIQHAHPYEEVAIDIYALEPLPS